MRSCRDDAETLILLDEVVIVEKRLDIVEAQNRRKAEPWVGVVAGSNIVEHAEGREDVLRQIEDRIRRRQNLKKLEEYFKQRRIQRDGVG
ncbi:hypothetical protein [Chlorobium phaeobacteroides]|uniref:Uncharacterized protein n=1 Tax=Chlorobium phaeobacteroides (strain DSM 266 / SMG 266 / 2430) TaxID=290317 RepID=A1BI48_CHLPD|nr:hypothetical protein [Chlorobium phaeobacteroides]ABL66075.1 hypothetical protein Cpha266_2063 [Chlorobium phaeobacteroides DSM 266]